MSRKFKFNALREHLAEIAKRSAAIQALIDESDNRLEDGDQPAAQDTPPAFTGKPEMPNGSAATAYGVGGMDAWASGPHGVKPKGLTANPPTAASRSLDAIPGMNRLRDNNAFKPTPQQDLYKRS